MFDIHSIPFSRRGSYLAVLARTAGQPGGAGIVLRSLRGTRPGQDLFRLATESCGAVSIQADPERLRVTRGSTDLEVCLPDPATVRLRARGAAVTLTRPRIAGAEVVIPLDESSVEVSLADGWKYRVTALAGTLEVDAPWDGAEAVRHMRLTARSTPGSGNAELAVEEYQASRPMPRAHPPFDQAIEAVRTEFREWLDAVPTAPQEYATARELCAYTCWSTLVDPSGLHHRPTMYMSKNWMHGVWSWDHCFNAMALASAQPDLAWDQYMTVFDHIHPSGLLPDNLTDTAAGWAFCKPPVHGWTLRWLIRNSDVVTRARLTEVYPRLAAWTDWWFSNRDDNDDGIPQYNHGNESGWDNSTAFAAGVPLDSPDLSAYLIVQLDTLAEAARALGRPAEAREWAGRADRLAARMVPYFTDGPDLSARDPRTGEAIRHTSLIGVMPLVAGQRLPRAVRGRLMDRLREDGPFMTAHGLATEPPSSPAYEPDGYWRGPIWAPTTFLLTEALRDLEATELADTVARRFCDMVRRSGPAENFDALSGRALRDPAFSWTASTFLLLAHRLQGPTWVPLTSGEPGDK